MSADLDSCRARAPAATSVTGPATVALTRRQCLIASLALLPGLANGQTTAPVLAGTVSEAAAAAIAEILAGRSPGEGRVRMRIPKLAENGLSVPLVVNVDSPMTAADHVRTLHIIAPANPIPTVARIHFTARSGEAFISTRIRLADTQDVLGFAQMSDDTVWAGRAHVIVTLGGCLDPVL